MFKKLFELKKNRYIDIEHFPSLFVQKNKMFFKIYVKTASNLFKTSFNRLDGLQI